MKVFCRPSDNGGDPNSSSPPILMVASILSLLSTIVNAHRTVTYDLFSSDARCPFSCNDDRSDWAHYQDIHQLDGCNQTILLDLNLYNPVDDPTSHVSIRSCAVRGSSLASGLERRQTFSFGTNSNSSITASHTGRLTTDIQILQRAVGTADTTAVSAAAWPLADHVRTEAHEGPIILFAKARNVIIGVYAGRQFERESLSSIVHSFPEEIARTKVKQAVAQICHPKSLGTQILGIFVDTTGDLAAVQAALKGWNDAECIGDTWGVETVWRGASVTMIPGEEITVKPGATNDDTKSLAKRATCQYTQVVAGDGCWSLATRCKVTQDELIKHNGKPDLCKTLVVDQYVCCFSGTLPDFSPQASSDGSCKTYAIKSGDLCATIAQKNSMTVEQINARNKKTWGWSGCQYLFVGGVICLSTGSPPMPAPVSNAVCGPQVPGTAKPADMSNLVNLNPCPLKACCNIWGQCGITKDFCISSPADTGAPGTAKPGSNGCIANCGMKIVNNGSPPASFKRVGYFEAWNRDRPCLHMLV